MAKRREHLNDRDKRVLVEMKDEVGYYIRTMAGWTQLTEAEVRRSYRKLRRMGLAYYTTLWDEDNGWPAGSGYILTGDGVAARDALATIA